MRVLVVVTQLPVLEGTAPGRCAVGLLRGLKTHGMDVRALAARPLGHRGSIPSDLLVDTVAVDHDALGLRRHIRRLSHPLSEFRTGPFVAMLASLAGEADIIHLDQTDAAFAAETVATPSVLSVHCLTRLDRRMGWPWTDKYRWGLESMLAERDAFRRHRYITASSPVVAEAIRRRAPRADVVFTPLTIAPQNYVRAPLDGPPTAGFIGTASWPPTARALKRLLDVVWPRVRRAVPDARLLIAGRHLRLSDDHPPGVEVVGEVGSASEFLSRLSVLLYPLPYGSGMKVKVLESIASGLPVVTTPSGAEGLDVPGGIVVATEDDQLADSATDILRDDDERRQRGALALEAFETRYAPAPATEALVDLYRRMT